MGDYGIIYFNDGEFLSVPVASPTTFVCTGDVETDEDGTIELTYKQVSDNEDEFIEEVITVSNESGSFLVNNEDGGAILAANFVNTNLVSDEYNYLELPYVYDYYFDSYVSASYDDACLVQHKQKNDYLVCEQKGYSLETEKKRKEFTLSYDYDSTDYEIEFSDDGTYQMDGDYDGEGEWTMLDDNLLIIYPPEGSVFEEYEEYYETCSTILYLDFDEDEVYVPVYVQCDEMLSVAQEAEIK